MATHPFLSVITASFNYGRAITNTLESVRTQRFKSLEHIVIDGGSTDNTVSILSAYQSMYNLRWVTEKDNGIADALNKGIKLARGTYIIVIHADDALISPNSLESASKHLRSERYDICSFAIRFQHTQKGIIQSAPIKFPGWYRFRNTIRHQGCFVHRRLYERLSGYKTTFAISMDYDFFYRAFRSGARIRYFDQPVALMGGEGVSSDPRFLLKRLEEEQTVQDLNEKNPLWRAAQQVFRRLYVPYKTRSFGRQLKRLKP
jgi:glycosyltransferase involved in cell wall biosynthesis